MVAAELPPAKVPRWRPPSPCVNDGSQHCSSPPHRMTPNQPIAPQFNAPNVCVQ
jgi:hypothetical protein